MTIDDNLRAIRDVIQHDIGNRGLARDPKRNLINAFPDDFAKACRSIAEHPSPTVALITGFYIANGDPPCCETDGPLGTIFLARALCSLDIGIIAFSDFSCKQALVEGLDDSAPGRKGYRKPFLSGDANEEVCTRDMMNLTVLSIPPSAHPWEAYLSLDWKQLVEKTSISHLVAIERVGPASDNRNYSMRGRDITEFTCPAHRLFEYTKENYPQVATIGIGDGGNEIGMGKIPIETIERNIPNGRQIACRVPTDQLIVAGISNWGAYALAAGVALVRGVKLDPSLFDPQVERKILETMVEKGPLVDGVTGKQTATVDGVAFDKYIQPLLSIGEIAMR